MNIGFISLTKADTLKNFKSFLEENKDVIANSVLATGRATTTCGDEIYCLYRGKDINVTMDQIIVSYKNPNAIMNTLDTFCYTLSGQVPENCEYLFDEVPEEEKVTESPKQGEIQEIHGPAGTGKLAKLKKQLKSEKKKFNVITASEFSSLKEVIGLIEADCDAVIVDEVNRIPKNKQCRAAFKKLNKEIYFVYTDEISESNPKKKKTTK